MSDKKEDGLDFEDKTSVAIVDRSKNDSDAHQSQPPCLILLSGSEVLAGQQWVLNQPKMILGRQASSDIYINDNCVSKIHARFSFQNGRVSVTDLGATNTTMRNSVALTPHQAVILENNDLIRTGTIIFKFLQHGVLSETSEKARMQGELESARTVQAHLLPERPEVQYPGLQLAGLYRPAVECGGDWWWHWIQEDCVFALIADATGHGAPAALITSAARSAVATVEDLPQVSIEKVYSTMSNAIRKVSGGKLTMSAFLIKANLKTRLIQYIDASHVPVVIFPKLDRPLEMNDLQFLMEPVSDPLGASSAPPKVSEFLAGHKMRLLMVTDGLSERKNALGQQIKESLFTRALIKAHLQHPQSSTEFLKAVFESSDAWAQGAFQDDDLTAVSLDFV